MANLLKKMIEYASISLLAFSLGRECSFNKSVNRDYLFESNSDTVSWTEYKGNYNGYSVVANKYSNNEDYVEIYATNNEDTLAILVLEEFNYEMDNFYFGEVSKGHGLEKYFSFDSLKKIKNHVIENYDSKKDKEFIY